MFVPNPSKKIPKKIAKKIKKLQNHFPALFIAKMGGDMPKKRKKKNFNPEFCSYLAWGRKFRKKIAKKFKKLKNLFPALFLAKMG